MQPFIIGLSVIGFFFAMGSKFCVEEDSHTKIFGKVPWSVIGMIGYTLIALTTQVRFVTPILATVAGIATVWLIIKAVKLKINCPFCVMVWLTNGVILLVAFVK